MAQAARVALALCALLLVPRVARRAEAVSYNVGNSAGWDPSADLSSWANGKTFYVGDVLVFQYSSDHTLYVGDVLVFQYSSDHTLNEVDEAGFNNCTAANSLLSQNDGNTTVPLAAPGDRYFICGNELHCLGGMKLHVLVNQPAGGGAPAGDAPQPPPQTGSGAANGPSTDDDAGIPYLVLGGSHRATVGPLLVTWLFVAAALLG